MFLFELVTFSTDLKTGITWQDVVSQGTPTELRQMAEGLANEPLTFVIIGRQMQAAPVCRPLNQTIYVIRRCE